MRDLLRWQLAGGRQRWPREVAIAPDAPPGRVDMGIRLSFVGHATVLVQTGGLNILTDPVWSERASPLSFAGPQRVHPPGIAFEDLPPIDLVLVSHNHYDHLDRATLDRLDAAHGPVFVTPLGNAACMPATIARERIVELDWDEHWDGPAVRVDAEPVAHWSARTRRDTNAALWGGFTLTIAETRIFFAGDTGFANGEPFRAAAAKHGRFDAALLPIGAYAPRWFMADAHMDPDEAVAAHRLLGCPPTLGIHWGTFQLTDEAREEPWNRLIALTNANPDLAGFRVVPPGGVWMLDEADSPLFANLAAR